MESGAFSEIAFDRDRSAMLLDNLPRDDQPQARAIGFSGKKRFEQMGQLLRGYSAATVSNGYVNSRDGRRSFTRALASRQDGGRYTQSSRAVQCVERIEQKIHKRLFQLAVIALNGVMEGAKALLGGNGPAFQLRFDHEKNTSDQFRSEEHTSELQSRFGISYAVF